LPPKQVFRFTVIVELKLKLERSLEDEKSEHLKTKEDLNALILDEKQLRNKQNVDSMNRYNEIKRNHEVLQVLYIYLLIVDWYVYIFISIHVSQQAGYILIFNRTKLI